MPVSRHDRNPPKSFLLHFETLIRSQYCCVSKFQEVSHDVLTATLAQMTLSVAFFYWPSYGCPLLKEAQGSMVWPQEPIIDPKRCILGFSCGYCPSLKSKAVSQEEWPPKHTLEWKSSRLRLKRRYWRSSSAWYFVSIDGCGQTWALVRKTEQRPPFCSALDRTIDRLKETNTRHMH